MTNPVQRAITKAGTQKTLADALNVSRQTVGYWLKRGEFPVPYIKKAARATGLPVSALLSRDQKVLTAAEG